MSSILTNLPQLTAATNSDWLYIVDVSDTTDNPAGSSKKILRGDLYAQITGFTYLNNTITLSLSDNSTYDVVIDTMTGLTINGVLSATTYENLPLDVFTTGGTYSDGTLTFTNNSGGTFSVSGLITGDTYTTGFTYNNNRLTIQQNNSQPDLNVDINSFTGLTIDGTISATTYDNLPLDVFTTGGTYSDGTLTFTNNSGGTFNVSGLYTGSTDIYTTGGTFNNSTGIATFTNNSGGTFDVSGFFKTSDDIYTTGFTFNVSNYDLTIKQNNGQTDLTVNLGILSSDITITGGTYNPTTGVATFTNNTGGTFSVSGFLTGMTDTYVSGFTYSNNNLTIKQTAGQPDLTVNISTMTGLTITGNLTVTGGTQSWFSGNSASDLVRITQTGSGNALVVEDANNPDTSPFVVNASGNVGVGTTTPAAKFEIKSAAQNNLGGLLLRAVASANYPALIYETTNQSGVLELYSGSTLTTQLYANGFSFFNGGNVGIGISVPTAKLHINHSGSGNSFLVEDSNNPDSTPFVIDNNGIVGVGTTSPSGFNARLVVIGTTVGEYGVRSTGNLNHGMVGNASLGYAGVYGLNSNDGIGTGIGVYGRAEFADTPSSGQIWIGGKFEAAGDPVGTSYSVQLLDGTEGVNKILVSQTSDGKANWSSVLSGLTSVYTNTISATTYYNLPLDVYTTGGTYSNGTLTFTNNSGGTFNVSGLITGDTYWTSGSTGSYSIKANNDSILDSTNDYAVAEGRDTLASGIASHAEGFATTASGNYGSHSEGDSTLASGEASHAEGVNTIASGDYSHAEGDNTTASGIRSHAEGGYTTASGQASHSEGSLTTASGFASHAEGDTTIASGSRSHAGGNNSAASGNTSFIHSTNSKVLGARSAVLGGQNITGTTDDTVYVPYFNIQSATTDNLLTEVLVKDTNGDVKTRNINTIIFTGGTITGSTNFTGGLSANTFSATTYYNLPLDIYTTGGTFNSITGVLTLTNNSGGTFNVSGFTTTTPTLSQVLSSGNTTSGYDIVISSGDTISNTGGTSSIYFGYGIEPNGVNLQSGISTLKSVVTVQELNGISFYHVHTGTTSSSSVTIHETNGVSLQAYDNTFTDQYTTIYQTGDAIIVEGDSTIGSGSTFSGIEYLVDYSNNYTNRSLVDKEYVDNLVSGSGAYLPLSGGTVSGATNFTAGLTANTFYTQYIDFNTTATTAHQEGRIHWNDTIKTLEIDTENSNVQIKVGHDLVMRVNNQTAATLLKGRVVYINGQQGQRPTVTLASYTADTTSASVIGLVMDDITVSSNGYIITNGILEGVDTSAYSAGTPLYLYTGGTLTSIKPQAPNHDVRIGKVIVSNATTGSIAVTIQNGYELDELHDVRITSATTGDLLVRSTYSGSDVWVNTKTLTGNYNVNGTLSATTLSATTYQNLPLDVFTTGGTYNSGTGVATFTNNSGGTFSVSGFTTGGGGGSFTGGTVSGATNFTGGLTANTISATTYNNLPKVGFSPINVGVCDTAPTAASTQYYYQTIGEVSTTLSKVKLWGFSGSDLVLFGIYRGTLGGSMTLIGQARGTCGIGPNELTLSAETGQNLTITAGEDLVVGYYADGTSWRTVYDTGISDILFGILNTGNITTMPATPTGTATGIRFACTLY